MQWEIIVHADLRYLEVITSGLLDKERSMAMAREIAKTMKKNRTKKALIDHRGIHDVSGNVIDIYERPKLFRIIGMMLGISIAEVVKPEHTEHFKFLETVCVNRGFNFSVFHEKEDALSWLLSS